MVFVVALVCCKYSKPFLIGWLNANKKLYTFKYTSSVSWFASVILILQRNNKQLSTKSQKNAQNSINSHMLQYDETKMHGRHGFVP